MDQVRHIVGMIGRSELCPSQRHPERLTEQCLLTGVEERDCVIPQRGNTMSSITPMTEEIRPVMAIKNIIKI